MALFVTENRLLLGAREAVAGTAEALTSANADVRVRDLELSSLEVEYDNTSSKYLTGDHTHDYAVAGIARGTIDFGIRMAKGEFHYTNLGVLSESRLPYGKYFESCGYIMEATEPTDSVTEDGYWSFYPQKEADEQTSTIALYDFETGSTGLGIEYKLAGCMGNGTISTETGKPFIFNVSMQGKVSDVTQVAHVNLPSFEDNNALMTISDPFLNTVVRITEVETDGSAKLGSTPVELCVASFSLDQQNTIAEAQCQSDSFGIKNMVRTVTDSLITLNPYLVALEDFNFWTAMTGEKAYKLELLSYSDTAKTKPVIKITAPVCQMITANGADDNGFRRLEMSFRPLRNWQGADATEKQWDHIIQIYGVNIID